MAVACRVMWLALWVGRMNWTLCCGWSSQWARWHTLAHSKFPVVFHQKIVLFFHKLALIHIYYITTSVGGQDESTPALWLATWAINREPSCPLRAALCVPREINKNLVNNHPSWPYTWSITHIYYMASFASRQDESNLALCMAPEQARWSYLARSGLPAVSCKKTFPKSHIINSLLTKLVQSRWLDIGQVFFCKFMDLDSVSVHKHAKKKKELGQYPAILTSDLVNNPYISTSWPL